MLHAYHLESPCFRNCKALTWRCTGLLKFSFCRTNFISSRRSITRRYIARVMLRMWHSNATIARIITAIYSLFFSPPAISPIRVSQPALVSLQMLSNSCSLLYCVAYFIVRTVCLFARSPVRPSVHPSIQSIHPSIFFIVSHFARYSCCR